MNEREAILYDELDAETEAEFEAMLSDMQADDEEDERWRITNDNLADWAVRKIQEERAENQRLHDIAQDQIDRITAKLHAADSRLTSRTSFLLHRLNEYFDNVPHKETKTQAKYQLLSGALVLTKAKETLKQDDEALIAYLKGSGNTEFIQTVEKPRWGEYKKQLAITDGKVIDTTTGDILDCVHVERKEASFDVK